ncbi:MAG: ABC transporter permease [Propionibacteriaceae bacterium]|jgi:ABC-2 type transport system permease protein|nr:ABC transporter permease [Propionibacteriaceae bacterium]
MNIWNVIVFEVGRTLRKPSFWLTTLLIPILIVVIGGIAALASLTSAQAANSQSGNQVASFEYTDASGLIDAELASKANGTLITDPALGLADVQAGRVDAFIAFPQDPATQAISIAAVDAGIVENGKYDSLARSILDSSVERRVDDERAVQILRGDVQIQTTTYRGGEQAAGLGEAIVPLLFAVLFFLLITLMGNQMLSAFLEEKENRVVEMVLTTIDAASLLAGKIVSLLICGLVQASVFVIPAVIGLTMLNGQSPGSQGVDPASVDGDFAGLASLSLTLDPQRMIVGALILIGAFCLNMVSVVSVGMIMPTAKEAGGLFTPVMLASVLPLYIAGMMVTTPENPVVQAVTYFPWSGGLTGLVRNAFGTLSLGESVTVIAIQFSAAALMYLLAVRICRTGLISYTKPLNLRAALRSN